MVSSPIAPVTVAVSVGSASPYVFDASAAVTVACAFAISNVALVTPV